MAKQKKRDSSKGARRKERTWEERKEARYRDDVKFLKWWCEKQEEHRDSSFYIKLDSLKEIIKKG